MFSVFTGNKFLASSCNLTVAMTNLMLLLFQFVFICNGTNVARTRDDKKGRMGGVPPGDV